LVIETSLYYDARSEKHQIMPEAVLWNLKSVDRSSKDMFRI